MKNTTLVIVLLFSINLTAQSWFGKTIKGNGNLVEIERNVNEYEKINIAGPFEVTLVKGMEGKLSISIDKNLKDHLITEIKGETLIIRWEKEYKIRPKNTVKIRIPFKEIEGVSLAGSGSIKTNETLKATNFNIKLAGSGSINLVLDTYKTNCTMAGSGTVVLVGSSDNFKCSKAGSGDFFGYDFTCKSIDIVASGSGNAQIFVTDSLKAKIAGSGNIIYKGNPKKDRLKVVGSGRILMK